MPRVDIENYLPTLKAETPVARIEVSAQTLEWLIGLIPSNDMYTAELEMLRERAKSTLWTREANR